MFWEILLLVVLAIVTLIVYNLLKIFVLDKININKWLVFALGVLLVMVSSYFMGKVHQILSFVLISISVMPFLWFFNINNTKKIEKKKNIIIKPKAKPNRVKNNK
jgi:Ca2+/Na+ antiporter